MYAQLFLQDHYKNIFVMQHFYMFLVTDTEGK